MSYLAASDLVGVSFFITSMALMASTVFFFLERQDVVPAWRTSLSVACLVTGVAFVHYMYMRAVWLEFGTSPLVLRYVDWFITVPLQIVEFYLIIKAVGQVKAAVFWKLLAASTLMLVFGYIGETGFGDVFVYFILGMIAWLYILYLLFFGDVALGAMQHNKPSCMFALHALRWIVTVGWAIYPVGYALGYFMQSADPSTLNVLYNFADFVNKIAFGLVIWAAARMDTPELHAK